MNRRLVHFSCGAASAVAAKLTLAKYPREQVVIVNAYIEDEHKDNRRFLSDVDSHWVRWWAALGYPHYDEHECIQIRDHDGKVVQLDGLGESEMCKEGFVFTTQMGIMGYHRKGAEVAK
jgi:hypothetical protein